MNYYELCKTAQRVIPHMVNLLHRTEMIGQTVIQYTAHYYIIINIQRYRCC